MFDNRSFLHIPSISVSDRTEKRQRTRTVAIPPVPLWSDTVMSYQSVYPLTAVHYLHSDTTHSSIAKSAPERKRQEESPKPLSSPSRSKQACRSPLTTAGSSRLPTSCTLMIAISACSIDAR